ncbi:hypothetical protein, partial [Peribacillus deserti]|uniref:hypothetical protein n=1 Tax=Peribacillus deserti TaxID=673318 RepID=UPI001C60D614
YHARNATSCGPAWLAHPVHRALARHKTSGSKRPILPFNGDWLDPRCQSGAGQTEKRKAVPSPITLLKEAHD